MIVLKLNNTFISKFDYSIPIFHRNSKQISTLQRFHRLNRQACVMRWKSVLHSSTNPSPCYFFLEYIHEMNDEKIALPSASDL